LASKKDFIKDSLVYGLGNGIKKFIGFFLLPIYTRALTPEDYGLLGTLGTFTMLLSAFLNFGLDSASGYYYFLTKDSKEKGEILFTHFILRILGIIPPIILSFFSSQLSLLFFKSIEYSWLVFISIIVVPVNLLMSEQSHIYRYFRKPWSYNVITIVKAVTNIVFGIGLVLIIKMGVLGAQIASILSSLIVVAGSFLFFTRRVYTWSFNLFWAKKMMRFGFPLIWAGLSVWVFNSIDRFFILYYKDLKEIGYYSIGTTFSQPILLINMAVQMSFGVLFFKTFNDEIDPEKPKARKMATDSFNIYLIVSVYIALFLSIFSLELFKFVATAAYAPGAISIPFITFSYIASQAYQNMGPGITIAEKNYHYLWITIFTAILNIGLNFLFIPTMGFVGAALATLISFVAYWLIKYFIAQRYFPIDYNLVKILLYFFVGLIIALFIPVGFFYFKLQFNVFMKIGLFMIGLTLPFVFQLADFSDIRSILSSVRNRIIK